MAFRLETFFPRSDVGPFDSSAFFFVGGDFGRGNRLVSLHGFPPALSTALK
jgi:hypothetical protein